LSNSTACDGGFSDHDLSDGWGFVIRDSEGVVIGDGYGSLQKVLEPLHAELVACLQAVVWGYKPLYPYG